MLTWIKRISVLLAGVIVFGLFAVWLLVSSSMLANMRGDLTARYLTGKLGQAVKINAGVRVGLGSVLQVAAQGLVLPSQTMAETNLAEVGQLEFEMGLRDLLSGRVTLSNIQVEGAKINLLVDQDATMSWTTSDPKPSPDPSPDSAEAAGTNVADFLAGQEIRLSNSGVTYKDARNGMDLELDLTSLELSQKDRSAPMVFQGGGTLNGQELTLNGTFPQDQPFTVTADFSQISVVLDGAADPAGYAAGFSTAISVEIAELGQFLDVFKLQKSLSGTGRINAVLEVSTGAPSISDLDVSVDLDGGQSLELTGTLGKLDDAYDVTLDTKIRLYSPDGMPPPTGSRRDLKLTGIDMVLIARPEDQPLRRMVIETNGFVLDTGGVGLPPISLSQISRTPDGLLRVGKLVVRVGPTDAPFLIVEGAVEDALRLEGIDLQATLALSAASLLAPELLRDSDVLGRISGGFKLQGSGTRLALSDLNAAVMGTDLWQFKVAGSVGDALTFSDVALKIDADIPSGAALLDALDLKPVETGPVTLNAELASQGPKWQVTAQATVAQSQLGIATELDLDEAEPTVRGRIESDLIRVQQLRDIAAAIAQLRKLGDLDKAATQQAGGATLPEEEPDAIPMVLEDPQRPDSAPADASQAEQGPLRDVTLQPLGRAILLSGVDLQVTVDLAKIEGERGISSLKSDLELKDQQARLGPVKFEYGGGYFDISGSMDLENKPETLELTGSASGWDFGDILREFGFKKRASGTLRANFDVSGKNNSVREFVATLRGRATVSMKNGSVDSQLLDLAGLGVVPWLFSKDKKATVTIVCMRAPLQISRGRISSEQAVVETSQVQVVLVGNVDLRKETLDIIGQPRRIGKPLSRSPWPFTAVGSFTKPNVKLKDGPRRLRRKDGASTMPERRKICVPDILQLK